MYEINKWDERFETAHTRKRQRLGWYLAPSGTDSKGYRKLMRNGKEGIAALGVFSALCQYTATLPKKLRGRLANSDGSPMDIEDISEITRMEVADIRHASGMLVACGWLTLMDKGICQGVPPICQPSAASVPALPKEKKKKKEQGEEKEKGEVQVNGTALAHEPIQNQMDCSISTDGEPLPSSAMTFPQLMIKVNDLKPAWARPSIWSHSEQRTLFEGVGAQMQELDENEWDMLKTYLNTPLQGAKGFWQPHTRGKFCETFSDVLSSLYRWAEKSPHLKKKLEAKKEENDQGHDLF